MGEFFNSAFLILSLAMFTLGLFKLRSNRINVDRKACSRSWERTFAAIFDYFLISILFYALSSVAKLFTIKITDRSDELFAYIISWLYFSILESSKTQGSIGKIMQGLKVTDINGERISFAKANLRYFLSFFSFFSLLLGILQIPFTKYRQALHDSLTNTLVMKRL